MTEGVASYLKMMPGPFVERLSDPWCRSGRCMHCVVTLVGIEMVVCMNELNLGFLSVGFLVNSSVSRVGRPENTYGLGSFLVERNRPMVVLYNYTRRRALCFSTG